MRFPRFNFIRGYTGHNAGFFCYGPNWFQFTFPPRRREGRTSFSLIIVWREGSLERSLREQRERHDYR